MTDNDNDNGNDDNNDRHADSDNNDRHGDGTADDVQGIDGLEIGSLAARPWLTGRLYDIAEDWPAFVPHDLVASTLLGRVAEDFPEYCVVATDPDGDRVVARGLSVPFHAELDGREETPDQGWDRVLTWAYQDRRHGRAPTIASALEITVDTAYLGRGLSYRMLAALRQAAASRGHATLLAPVRPTAKLPYDPSRRGCGSI
ncbi:hypothetical protein [Streptomyces sp. NPDC002851]